MARGCRQAARADRQAAASVTAAESAVQQARAAALHVAAVCAHTINTSCPVSSSVRISSRYVASASADTLKTPPVAVCSQDGDTCVICQHSPRAGGSAVATSACRGADDLVTAGMARSGRALCSVTSGQPACRDSCATLPSHSISTDGCHTPGQG